MMIAVLALASALRIVSLDQCADQYALALADRSEIAALSPRAVAADSWLRKQAQGLPRARPSTEAVIARRPTLVLRQWGGGPRLEGALKRAGVPVADIDEAHNFDGVRRDIRTIARAVGHPERGEALIGRMDTQLAGARGAWAGRGALYLTDGAYTAGPGTLVDAILRATGLTNRARHPGFAPAPLERVMLDPPAVLVFGRFDAPGHGRWAPVRGSLLSKAAARAAMVKLPGALLACPAWFAGDAVERLAQAARR